MSSTRCQARLAGSLHSFSSIQQYRYTSRSSGLASPLYTNISVMARAQRRRLPARPSSSSPPPPRSPVPSYAGRMITLCRGIFPALSACADVKSTLIRGLHRL
ncbi:uncharacterized protein PHACADRAFT_248871 [Phanerochaete carnosa HHB-10118-sp]|uniref:Uncharacterized protein n=1 Tax=Phanerochaete carnosa (strain HHB-10118-sp) TaxID=650164 RepID=K5V7N5_PHACS|nr:uncharacterized protein PHACADRAFT_248871 [Phanerochaete carnosa HHB-10118-sp]EKM58781.1 hypothetical protein PHACADRAFT_248871 [Phanerochaete carnosa HHB-10118-sp]